MYGMKWLPPFVAAADTRYSVVACAGYLGGAWNVVRNSDLEILHTGSLYDMVHRAKAKELSIAP